MWASLAGHNSVYHIGIQVPVICKYIYKCSPNLWFFLSLLLVSFEKKEFLIFTKSNFCILSFVLLMSYLRSHCLTQGQKDLLLSSKSFIVLVLTFISMMGFDLIFVLQCELRVQIYTFTPGYPTGQTPFVEEMQSNFLLTWSTKLVHFTLMKSTNFKLLKFAHAKLTRSQSDLMPLESLS